MFKSLADARTITHTLSSPSKMPWWSYSIPASACKVGSQLAKVAGTVCKSCYAMKGRYVFQNVKQAMQKRLDSLSHPHWVDAMVYQLNTLSDGKEQHFRHFDSGDLQGIWHLRKIVEVAERTPHIKHWLPTREVGMIREYRKTHGAFPSNLIVRVSASRVGHRMPRQPDLNLPVSTVGVDKDSSLFQCEAPSRGWVCGPCRKCWSDTDVNYKVH